MPRRALLNVILLTAIAAIAAAIWLTPPETEQPAPALVPGVDASSIDSIRVQRAGGADLRFRRDGDGWSMVEPVAAPAHEARINALLGLLTDQSLARLDGEGADLARFGLADPAVTVELGPHRIALGDPHPMDEQRYVLYGGAIHLVPDSLYAQLTQNAGFFIDNRLLPAGARPTRIRYPAFTLESADGAWRELPSGSRDAAALSAAAATWESARALAVRTPAKAADNAAAITVELPPGAPVVFEILALEPAAVLARRDLDIQYHLDAFTAQQLLLAPPAAAELPPPD
jgi:hypothetical protein